MASQTNPLASLHTLVWTALLAALIAVGSFIQFPVASVPFTLQTYFVLLAGFALGPVFGPAAVLVYLAGGVAGLPIFAGGKAGLAHLAGPTGGFLIGFALCAACCGLGRPGKGRKGILSMALAGLAGLAVLYVLGSGWLSHVLDKGFVTAFKAMLPFLAGDLAKLAVAISTRIFLANMRLLPA